MIGDGFNETEAPNAPDYHLTPAKDFGKFYSPAAVVAEVMRYAEVHAGQTVLEPSGGNEMLAPAARDRGA